MSWILTFIFVRIPTFLRELWVREDYVTMNAERRKTINRAEEDQHAHR